MKTPAKTGCRSRNSSDPPSNEAIKNPFCPARMFHSVKGDASTKGIAADRPDDQVYNQDTAQQSQIIQATKDQK